MACPGSHAMEAEYISSNESLSAREGITAHWLAQQYLRGNFNVLLTPPGNEEITKEMQDGAELYEYEIRWASKGKDILLHIEEPLDISNVHLYCSGIPDCWFLDGTHLYIYDYKFGHSFVDAFQNWQLLEYAAGICQQFEKISQITMTIIQPRCYVKEGHVRSWTLNVLEFMNVYLPRLQFSEKLATEENAEKIPSTHCGYCSARHACTALQQTTNRSIDVIKSYQSYQLDSRQTAYELKYLKQAKNMIEARLTGLEEQAKAMIMRGEYLPGFKLESGQGREHWTKNTEEVIMLGELMGLNLMKPSEVITPVQARKIGISEEILAQYSQRVSGKLKLVENNEAAKVFKK